MHIPFYSSKRPLPLSASSNLSAAPLTQKRGRTVGSLSTKAASGPPGSVAGTGSSTGATAGPSLNTWPRWLPQLTHLISMRPPRTSFPYSTPPLAVRQKDGQPEPESYLAAESKSLAPQLEQK